MYTIFIVAGRDGNCKYSYGLDLLGLIENPLDKGYNNDSFSTFEDGKKLFMAFIVISSLLPR